MARGGVTGFFVQIEFSGGLVFSLLGRIKKKSVFPPKGI